MPNPNRSVPAVVLLVALGLAAGCTGKSGGHGHGGPPHGGPGGEGSGEAFAPVPVEVETVTAVDLRRTVGASTTLRSVREIAVVSELAGTLREVAVEAGDRVESGQVLARIVNDDVRISVQEAEAAVERARREVERLRPLYDAGYLARQAFEATEFEFETARTNLARLRAQGASETVRAPSAGVVTARNVEPGEVVVPNQALFSITDVDALEARIAVPERELAALAVGQDAEILVEAYGMPPVSGTLNRIDPVVDPRTGTIEVRIDLDGVDHPLGRLRPGMFAGVRVITDVHGGVPAVPKRSVVREGGAEYLFVLGDEVERPPAEGSADPGPLDGLPVYAVRRVIAEFGYEDRELVEVLDGVSPGERVIVVGQNSLDAESVVLIPSDLADDGSGTDG